jgi:hypothetical protein
LEVDVSRYHGSVSPNLVAQFRRKIREQREASMRRRDSELRKLS